MKFCRPNALRCVLLANTFAVSGTLHAHHAMGGRAPATTAEGVLSGIAHSIIGFEHLVFAIGVGLLATRFGRRIVEHDFRRRVLQLAIACRAAARSRRIGRSGARNSAQTAKA